METHSMAEFQQRLLLIGKRGENSHTVSHWEGREIAIVLTTFLNFLSMYVYSIVHSS